MRMPLDMFLGDTFVAKSIHGPGAWFKLSFPLPQKHRTSPEAHEESIRKALDGLFKQNLIVSIKAPQDAEPEEAASKFEDFVKENTPHVSMVSNVESLKRPESLRCGGLLDRDRDGCLVRVRCRAHYVTCVFVQNGLTTK